MDVVLIGYRGSGKTTIGRKLADRLWRTFIDVDDLIVARAGKDIARIFAEDGEDHFRDVETEALEQALATPNHVLGLGGGTLIRPANRQMLKKAGDRIIYLRCEARELLRRIESDPQTAATRPALTALGGGLDEIVMKLKEREETYREMAYAEIDVSSLSVEQAVMRIAKML